MTLTQLPANEKFVSDYVKSIAIPGTIQQKIVNEQLQKEQKIVA